MTLICWLGLAWAAPIQAQDAVVRGTTLVYVSADGTQIVGHDVVTEQVTWRVPLADPISAAVAHVLDGNAVMVQGGKAYTTIDATTGAVLLRREAPPMWEFVHRGMGGCGLVAKCTLQPIDCADGHALGPLLKGPTVRFLDMDGDQHSDQCTDEPQVMSAAGGLTVVRVPKGEGFRSESELVGLRRDGQAWASGAVTCEDCEPLGAGVAPNGSVCWTTDETGPKRVMVRGFDCATGASRFEHSVHLTRSGAYVGVVTGWWPGGLLLAHGRGAVALDAATGAERWRTVLAKGELGVVEGLVVPSWSIELEVHTVVTLDGTTGAVLRREAVPNGQVVRVVAGQVVVESPGRSGGRGGGSHSGPLERFAFERGAPSSALYNGEVVGSWAGDAWVVGELVQGERAWLVVNEVRGKGDRLHIIKR